MKKRHVALLLICFTFFLTMLRPTPAQAEENDYDKMRLSVGLGLSLNQFTGLYPMPSLHLSYQYAFSSFYRMGIEGRLAYLPVFARFVPVVLWTHEFGICRSKGFEFTPRFGVGYQFYTALNGFRGEPAEGGGTRVLIYHGLAVNFGLGFGWVITDLIILRLGIDYGFTVSLGESDHGDLLHQLNVALNVVFRL